jgi:N-acetylneuraminic acid mutarotase
VERVTRMGGEPRRAVRSGAVSRVALATCLAWLACLPAACGSKPAAGGGSGPGQWTRAPSLPVARFEGYAAVSAGKVWFLGGITGIDGDLSTAMPSRRVDVFDPATQAWTTGPDLPPDGPKHHLAVTVVDDVIYVLGGFDGILDQSPNEPFRPIALAYALRGGAWTPLSSPPLARGAATAQGIDGKIYVTGGAPTEGQPPYDELDVYDIASDSWATGPPMPTAREHLASCAVDGKMIVVGGWVGSATTAQAVAEQFDPATQAWTSLPPMPTARGGLGAAAQGQECHAVGGEDWALPLPGTFDAHEVFDASSGAWSTQAPMPTSRHGLGVAWLDDLLYAVGGGPSQGNSYDAVVEVYTP